MFQKCTSLTTAPVLPATTLVYYCYHDMFRYCSKLNYIKAMFTTVSGSIDSYTGSWAEDVSSTGTFVKNAAATWNVTGIYGIPAGWTVETATAESISLFQQKRTIARSFFFFRFPQIISSMVLYLTLNFVL